MGIHRPADGRAPGAPIRWMLLALLLLAGAGLASLVSARAQALPPVTFQNGLAVVEAEDFDAKVPRSGRDWVAGQSPAGSVAGALKALPDTGARITSSIATTSPELGYRVLFPAAGSYRLWARTFAVSNGNTLHAGLDGQVSATNVKASVGSWSWTAAGTLSVPSAGEHTVQAWMREDGLNLDRLLVATSSTYTPSGTGPAATPRQGPAPDTTPPTLTGREPAPGASGVALSANAVATFSEAMDPATLTTSSFTVAPTAGGPAVAATISASSGNTVFTLDPSAGLAPATQYTATVTTAATDAAGNALASAQTWSFTTAAAGGGTGAVTFASGLAVVEGEDFDAKTARSSHDWVAGQSPAGAVGGALQAAPNNGAVLTASIATTSPELAYRVLFPAAGTYYLWLRGYPPDTAGNSLYAGLDGQVGPSYLFNNTFGAWNWMGQLFSGPRATLSVPSAGEHTVHLWMREDGLHLDRLLVATSSTYTPSGTGPAATPRQGPAPDTTPPTLTGREPAPGASGVALSANAVATFSEAMDPATLTTSSFTVAPTAGGPAVAATISASSGNTVFTLDPSAGLAPATQYTATVTTAATDAAGNALASAQTWSFTTAAAGGGTGAVTFASGLAVVEGEDFDAKTARSSHDWVAGQSPAGAVGGALQAAPNNGAVLTASIATTSPELAYRVLFPAAGTYYLWLRGYPPDTAGNSLYAGLDGQVGPSYLFNNTFGAWNWMGQLFSGPRATLSVPSAGEHTVHLWMREDGLHLDRLLLTANSGYTPSGTGPAVTPRDGGEPFAVNVNFQSEGAEVPAAHVRDFGQPYGARSGANQGTGLTYGWVVPGTHDPLSLVGNGRERGRPGVDQRLDTLIYVQGADALEPVAVESEGAWEIAVPSGAYAVTVGVGDGPFDPSESSVNVEGASLLYRHPSTPAEEYAEAQALARVIDGRLTVDARGGLNTKLTHLSIAPAPAASGRPSIAATSPTNAATGVVRNVPVSADVVLPNPGAGIDAASLGPETVRLTRIADGGNVPATLNTSGGGDVVVLQPQALLAVDTAYRFEVTDGLKDLSGAAFLPFASVFTTGTDDGGGQPSPIAFEQVSLPTAAGRAFTSLVMGPDGKLYAGVNDGTIVRFPVIPDGTTGAGEVITSLRNANGGSRLLLGLAFHPSATAENLVLLASHSFFTFSSGPDWTGKISRLSGPGLGTVADVVVGLPRSIRDHVTNSLAFGPDGALYVNQGSNSSMGAPDDAWGNRPERALNAAVLRVDLAAIGPAPLDVKTEDGGTYDPFAAGSPVTVFASGLRNAFDLLWHTNGRLYVPTNGAGFGGNVPGTPSPLPASCQRRIDSAANGPYLGPQVGALEQLPAQSDYLFRVAPGGYYGHPNPQRCEWVMNGGNPTGGADPAEVVRYPVGTQPDRNWRGFSFDFGQHYSPNGLLEYRGGAFGGALRGKLVVARYSAGDDLIVLTPGGPLGDIVGEQTGITGFTGLQDPLDVVEHPVTGNIYVSEYGGQRITLLRPGA